MTEPAPKDPEAPVWARPDAFPEAPPGWGWVNSKGKPISCESAAALAEAIRKDPDGNACLVWIPSLDRMVLPEEVAALAGPIREARERWTRDDLADAAGRLRWFGLILIGSGSFVFFRAFNYARQLTPEHWEQAKFAWRHTVASSFVGLAFLMFVIFALIPWFQARKRRAALAAWDRNGMAAIVPPLRFETWLGQQRAPVTIVFLGLISLVGLAQLMPGTDSIAAAGLDKQRYAQGEWWRLLTAPFLHGNPIHFLFNAAAMAYLGKRLEVFARWPHLAMVFLFAAGLGGEASARFVAAPSVGASGGLLGWLGFLLVFETLHCGLVPRSSRQRLAVVVGITAFIGAMGYRFIDNAAHAGGLIAGIVYAAIVFPASRSVRRPEVTTADLTGGTAALVVLTAAAGFAIWQITGR